MKMNHVLTGKGKCLTVFIKRCHMKIVLRFPEFIVQMQDIPTIEISKDFLLVRPRYSWGLLKQTKPK